MRLGAWLIHNSAFAVALLPIKGEAGERVPLLLQQLVNVLYVVERVVHEELQFGDDA